MESAYWQVEQDVSALPSTVKVDDEESSNYETHLTLIETKSHEKISSHKDDVITIQGKITVSF
jgi:hypothetical protein